MQALVRMTEEQFDENAEIEEINLNKEAEDSDHYS